MPLLRGPLEVYSVVSVFIANWLEKSVHSGKHTAALLALRCFGWDGWFPWLAMGFGRRSVDVEMCEGCRWVLSVHGAKWVKRG